MINKIVSPFARDSLRTIALAYKELDSAQDWDATLSDEEALKLTGTKNETYQQETGLTFLSMVGIEDPLRETVTLAIQKCNKAGVDVRMVRSADFG